VARHRHRDAFGNAGADEIADGDTARIVRDAPRTAGVRQAATRIFQNVHPNQLFPRAICRVPTSRKK
jgi:hypothetical protein